MSLIVEIRFVNLGDCSADSSCLGIPADMMSDCVFRHDALLRWDDVVLPIKRGIDRNVSQGAATAQRVANMIRFVLAAFAALSLSACASSVLVVEQPYAGQEKFTAATVEFDNGGVPIDNDNRAYTQEKLEQELFMGDSPIFAKGDGLTVKWRYVGFNEGSRLGRYLTGGIGGGSKVVLEVDFINQSGEILATVRGEGSVGGGLFGGSNKTGIDKAARHVADYAASNLR